MQITANDVLKLLKDNNFEEQRTKGDHHRFKDSNGHKVTLAYTSKKDNIPLKTYKSILKQAGLK